MAIPQDGKWHLQHHCVLKGGRKSTCWKAAHPKTGKIRTVIRAGLPGGKKHPSKAPQYEAFKGIPYGVGPRPAKIEVKGAPKDAEIREWIESEGVIQEIAWAEPKKRGAMVYVPHKAFYDWRDGKGDKNPADMKVTRQYLEAMAGDKARVYNSEFKHPETGEAHHGVEFHDADHAADFIEKLHRAGVQGDILWHYTGD